MINNEDTWGKKIYGKPILQQTKEQLQPFKKELEKKELKVAIIQFDPQDDFDEYTSLTPFFAANKSTQAKIKTFTDIGIKVDSYNLPWETTRHSFGSLLTRLGEDRNITGIIVQYPMSPEHSKLLSLIPEDKDLDFLRGYNQRFTTPATSEAITRVINPFTKDDPVIAVVGAKGFVGRGVIDIMKQKGLQVLSLDKGDDIIRVRDSDIVVAATGQPNLLDERHLTIYHRLVVDCGFSPIGGEIYGNVNKSAYGIPQYITPVPGGTGPMEMAVLAERVIEKELQRNIEPWTLPDTRYLTREQVAAIVKTEALKKIQDEPQIFNTLIAAHLAEVLGRQPTMAEHEPAQTLQRSSASESQVDARKTVHPEGDKKQLPTLGENFNKEQTNVTPSPSRGYERERDRKR